MGLVRLVVFGFLFLGALYLLIAAYSRSIRREKLENRWDAENPDSSDKAARDTYVKEGVAAYNASFRPKLITLVFIIPPAIVATIVYVTNAN